MLSLFRPARALGALLFLGLALAGCTITSNKPLVDAAEAATPLPDAFTYVPYEAGDGAYTPASDAPANFVRNGNSYVASDVPDMKGTITARFVPLGNETYLMAATITGEPSTLYGFATYVDSVLAIALTPDEKTVAALKRVEVGIMPQARKAIAGLAIDKKTDGIVINSRAGLDYLSNLYVAGHLPMAALSVGYVSLDPSAPPPSRLVHVGRNWLHTP